MLIEKQLKKGNIPKIIHQIWLGSFNPPSEWINSWKNGFCKEYNWKHKLWRESDIEEFKLKNEKEYNKSDSYQGKSDIARYEILERYGGMYLDCDMIWLGSNLIEYIPLETSSFIGVQEPPSKSTLYVTPPFLANGFIASAPKHPILKKCIDLIPARIKLSSKHAFIKTGPTLLNMCINEIIDIIPYFYVFPKDFHIKTDVLDPLEFKDRAIIFTYNGEEYPHLKKLKTFIK